MLTFLHAANVDNESSPAFVAPNSLYHSVIVVIDQLSHSIDILHTTIKESIYHYMLYHILLSVCD